MNGDQIAWSVIGFTLLAEACIFGFAAWSTRRDPRTARLEAARVALERAKEAKRRKLADG